MFCLSAIRGLINIASPEVNLLTMMYTRRGRTLCFQRLFSIRFLLPGFPANTVVSFSISNSFVRPSRDKHSSRNRNKFYRHRTLIKRFTFKCFMQKSLSLFLYIYNVVNWPLKFVKSPRNYTDLIFQRYNIIIILFYYTNNDIERFYKDTYESYTTEISIASSKP